MTAAGGARRPGGNELDQGTRQGALARGERGGRGARKAIVRGYP